jgi:PAS domain S-box-containing protein
VATDAAMGTAALQSAGILMAITRARDGVILDVNDAYCAMAGLDRSQLVGKKSTELDLYAGIAYRDRVADEVMTTGSVHNKLVDVRLPSGETGHLAFTISRMEMAGEPCFMVAAVDVGRQKAAEEALRASEARFAATFKYAGVMMLIARPADGRFVDANDAFLRETGLTREAAVGKTAAELSLFVDPRDGEELGRRLQRDGYVQDFEVPVRNRDGELSYGLISATVTEVDGRPQTILAILNTTERRRAEEALRTSEQRYRNLFEQTADGVLLLDEDGRIVDVNPALAAMLGRRVDELPGTLWTDYWDPGELRNHPFIRPAVNASEPIVFERRCRRPDGTTVELEIHARYTAAGLVMGTARDVGARKAAESERARLFQAIEQSGESVIITEPAGAIVYVNAAFEKEMGYSRDEMLGQNLRILRTEGREPDVYGTIRAEIEKNGIWSDEVTSYAKDGSIRRDLMSVSPVRDRSGALVNFVAVRHDFTHERELEDQLRQAQKMEAVGRLAGGVAHDFNNLLTAISGFTELANGEAEPGSQLAEYLAEIRASAERATVLTRQLLAFGRRAVVQQKVLDLNQVVEGLAPMLQRIIGEDVRLEVRGNAHLECILADRGQLEQVIVNLAANARDAMPGGGQLTIDTDNVTLGDWDVAGHPEMRPGRFVRMTISDTGAGMDAGTTDHIFEPFFTTKDEGSGTGLGLATVFGIVGRSGGRVGVVSEPGKGSVFRVELPAVQSQADAIDEPVVTNTTVTGRETVLIVEDEPAVLGFAARLLARNGYTVLRAAAGDEAVEIARIYPSRIDLLFSDIVMPGLTGQETAAAVGAMRPEIRHLLASGYSEEMNAQRGAAPLGMPFIEKPYSAGSLLAAVRHALDA